MRHISLAAGVAALIVAANFSLAPAMAEMGGPMRVGPMCKSRTPNDHNGDFYVMKACPTPAAATIERHHHHHRG